MITELNELNHKYSLARAQKSFDLYIALMTAARDTYYGNPKEWQYLNRIVADMYDALERYTGTLFSFVQMVRQYDFLRGYIVANGLRGYSETEMEQARFGAYDFGTGVGEYECELMLPLVQKFIKDNKDFLA